MLCSIQLSKITLSPVWCEDFIAAEETLVQLGYNRAGDPILFLAKFQENQINFPSSGLKCTLEIFDMLRPVNFRIPNYTRDMHH